MRIPVGSAEGEGAAHIRSGGAPDTCSGRGSWPALSCPALLLNSVFPSGSRLAALIPGTPKSWAPNSGCGGLGSVGQQEVTQRPACPSPPNVQTNVRPGLGFPALGKGPAQDTIPHIKGSPGGPAH